MDDSLIAQTRQDLAADFEELLFLAYEVHKKLLIFNRDIKAEQPPLSTTCLPFTKELLETLKRCRQRATTEDIDMLITQKRWGYEQVRRLTSLVAGIITGYEWQSPSYDHSLYPQAGRQTGKVTGNITDYSRDQLIAGNEYQRIFSREFVGSWRTIPIQTLLTQSGMAALTTVLTYLLMKGHFTRPVLMGKHSYFQNQELITKLVPQPVIRVDEDDTASILTHIRDIKPSAIFLDTVCNAAGLHMPDLYSIKRHLFVHASHETYLVIDNTCAHLGFNPLHLLLPFRGKIKLLVFESLNKYYQYGLDRTIGGVAWGLPQDASGLFYARLHAGTIMSDMSTAMLPTPNNKMLLQRIKRLSRNTLWMAQALTEELADSKRVSHIVYPQLPTHSSYPYAKKYRFTGASFNLIFKPRYQRPQFYRKVIHTILHEAKKANIPLIAGSSFGLSTTRVYVTALNANKQLAEPFMRISLGTETRWELEQLLQVFGKALTT